MNTKTMRRTAASLLAAALLLTTAGCGKKEEAVGFQPKLDTKADIQLEVTGFFGNFEALDQVTNDFNQYYPNVTFGYQQVSGDSLEAYLEANPNVDIFMTSMHELHSTDSTLAAHCVDLNKEDVSLEDIDPDMLKLYSIDDRQIAIPMSQDLYGVIVNETLLENAGLSLPKTAEEFLNSLKVLKDKGYTPIQGPTSKVYAELTRDAAFAALCSDEKLYAAAKAGSDEAVNALMPIFDFLDTILENGYTDPEINASYPDDNYDGAILRFFEGEVPFWVCNTEKVSGMKKRESKSEAYQKNSFSYTYIFTPVGSDDGYVFQEPWSGFSANENGAHRDYAIEFLRFLATRGEINKMADVKGVPSVAKEPNTAGVYEDIFSAEGSFPKVVNTGEITPGIESKWYSCTTNYVNGNYDSAESAIRDFLTAFNQ